MAQNEFRSKYTGAEIEQLLGFMDELQQDGITSGTNGWTAVLSIVADGERRILQVIDWIGGTENKPSTDDQYIGLGGFVTTPAEAIDIRGDKGQDGKDGEDGADGTSVTIQGRLSVAGKPLSPGVDGEAWLDADGDLWVWAISDWENVGKIQGPAGQSAYEIAQIHGWDPVTDGNEAAWIISLQGKDGKDGKDGNDGTNGEDGEAGKITAVTAEGIDADSPPEAIPGGTDYERTIHFKIPAGATGPQGETGGSGWSPLFALENDGNNTFLKVVDWVGGDDELSKPEIEIYLGNDGFVEKEEAINIRGSQGNAGSPGIGGSPGVAGKDGLNAYDYVKDIPGMTEALFELFLSKAEDLLALLEKQPITGTITIDNLIPVVNQIATEIIDNIPEVSGTITWSPALTDNKFGPLTSYTAIITLTANAPYVLDGLNASNFIVTDGTVQSYVAPTLTVTFPATFDTPSDVAEWTLPFDIPAGLLPSGGLKITLEPGMEIEDKIWDEDATGLAYRSLFEVTADDGSGEQTIPFDDGEGGLPVYWYSDEGDKAIYILGSFSSYPASGILTKKKEG